MNHQLTDEERDARTADMIQMRKEGVSLQNIGDKYGISRERVRQLTPKIDAPVHVGFETEAHYLVYCSFIVSLLEEGRPLKWIQHHTGLTYKSAHGMAVDGGFVFKKRNSQLLGEGLRRCSRCSEVKELKNFGRDSKSKFGLSRVCKSCNSANTRAQYQRKKAFKNAQ